MRKALFVVTMLCTVVLSWSFIKKDNQITTTAPSIFSKTHIIETDTAFLQEAASSSRMEILLGNMAQEKAASQQVKDFGAMMVRDHTAATQDLMAVAQRLNFTPRDSMLNKHSRHVEHLTGVTGSAFDRSYLDMILEAHKEDIDEFEDASTKAQDTAVRGFASRQLPILKMHLDSARALRGRLQ